MSTRKTCAFWPPGLCLLFCPLLSQAELNFCNDSPVTIDAAVGEYVNNVWQSRGWYPLGPGDCAIAVGGDLTNRYFYYYGNANNHEWTGDHPFCTASPNPFTMQQGNCTPDGLRNFRELDVQGHSSYTVSFTCDDCLDPGLATAMQRGVPMLQSYAERVIPQTYDSGDWQDVGPVDIQYGFTRSPLGISLDGTQLRVSVRVAYWVAVSNLVLGIRFDTASCGLGEDSRLVDAALVTTFGLNAQNRLVSKTRIDNLSFPNRCQLTFADIDVTDRIDGLIRSQLERVAREIDSRVPAVDLSGLNVIR